MLEYSRNTCKKKKVLEHSRNARNTHSKTDGTPPPGSSEYYWNTYTPAYTTGILLQYTAYRKCWSTIETHIEKVLEQSRNVRRKMLEHSRNACKQCKQKVLEQRRNARRKVLSSCPFQREAVLEYSRSAHR